MIDSPRNAPPGAASSSVPPAMRDFSRNLPVLLLRSHQALMAEFRPILRRHKLTETQWRVLRALTTDASVRIAQLSALTLISGPSLTRILRGLEERKLITRSAEPSDQRAARISLSASGQRLLEQVAPLCEQCYLSMAARLGQTDMDDLYRLLHSLPERLGGKAVD